MAAAALTVCLVPTVAALRATAVCATPQVCLIGSCQANLAMPLVRAGTQVAVPPSGLCRKNDYVVLLAEPASKMIGIPALVGADLQ